ncbi:MAG: hypothetical protein IH623_25710 [Verrucomicrobia bacterium]|nr:hypothetical protein [Verrucomicrobiota bacterium]
MKLLQILTPRRVAFLTLAAVGVLGVPEASAVSYHETVLADGPVVYYRLEDPAGSQMITNAVNPATHLAYVTQDDYFAWPKFEQPGVGSNSVSFHLYTPEGGTLQRSRIELPFEPELNQAGPFTAECWVRPTSWGSDYRCPLGNFGGWGASPTPGWHFYQTPGEGATSSWVWVQKGGNIWLGGTPVTKNKWDHLVATYDGTTVNFYVNGVLRGSTTDTSPAPNTFQPLTIGWNPAGGWVFDGNVDEVAIYTKALTAEQITLHYEVGLTNFYSGPLPAYVVADPVPATAYAGRTATFVVSADGTEPLSYQWYKGDTAVEGATGDTLAFTSAYADNGATYKVVVTNLYGSATSAPVALTVMTDLTLVSSPVSITRTVGSKAAFLAASGGALPVTYQWYKGTTAIPGGTNQTLWLSNLQLTEDNSTYYAHITNPWSATNSETATLNVTPRAVDVPITGYAKVVMADDPVAFWRLDEAEGSFTAVDAAGSFDGTYTPGNGAVTYATTTGIPMESNPAVGVTGGARVSIPWALELSPRGPFTTEAWFKPATLAADSLDYRTVFSSLGAGPGGSGPNGWLLYQQPNNTFAWVLFNQGWLSSFMGDPISVIQANTWYHMALTYDGSLFRIYVNGQLTATQAYAAFIPNQDGAINLGWRSDNGWNPFDGTLDDVAIYNKALTLEQVQAHYMATVRLALSRSGNDLILSWPFGTLQQADSVTGTYTDMPAATSPHTITIGTLPKFYRVKVQ